MKIEIVQLENIRSHVKSTVPFTRGFNCLVGGLGCGKSSVLYAVDFALFGDHSAEALNIYCVKVRSREKLQFSSLRMGEPTSLFVGSKDVEKA